MAEPSLRVQRKIRQFQQASLGQEEAQRRRERLGAELEERGRHLRGRWRAAGAEARRRHGWETAALAALSLLLLRSLLAASALAGLHCRWRRGQLYRAPTAYK